MAEHFKLEITNRSTKITVWNDVSPNFADEYRENLVGSDDDKTVVEFPMSDAMKTIFSVADTGVNDEPVDKPKNVKHEELKGKYSTYNYVKRIKQRRTNFKTLAYINFATPDIQFVTLTFDSRIFENASVLDDCHLAFRNFIKRIRHRFDDFRYLAVFSRQKNGNWHYHMLCNFDETVSGKMIRELWGVGRIENTVVSSWSELSTKISYCIDNMEQVAWDDLQGEKGYLCSKGLQNRIVLRSWNENEREKAFELLADIIGGNDKPLPMKSVVVGELLSQYEIDRSGVSKKEFSISYLVSHKGFAELFEKPVVARLKNIT